MLANGYLRDQLGWSLTPNGIEWLASVGADVEAFDHGRRPLVRQCIDWTEREPHLAGRAGAALCDQFFVHGWIARYGTTRAVRVTDEGRTALVDHFSIATPVDSTATAS